MLQKVPFLYLLFVLILFGAVVDLRLRVTKAIAIPILPWAAAFFVWALITVGIMKPEGVMVAGLPFFITVTVFVVVAQSIQSFKMFEVVVMMLIFLGGFLTWVAIDQATAPLTCVKAVKGDSNGNEAGTPDGRPCVKAWSCYADNGDPTANYVCERPGIWGTTSTNNRVRYRGILQDPNELSIALSTALALLIALWLRTKKRRWKWITMLGVFFVGWAIMRTGSRSGQLGFMATFAAFFVWKYRAKAIAVMIPLGIPVLLAVAKGGSGRGDADESSLERYGAWQTGLDLFKRSPLWGIGFGQFNEHHFLTAHNTYVLVLAEMGIVGAFIFSMIIWISIKIPLTALKRYHGHPEAEAAEIWSVALLACMASILSGCLFLSFAYHFILWIFLGLSGALYVVIKEHDPEFEVKIGFLEAVLVLVIDLVIFVVLTVFLKTKNL